MSRCVCPTGAGFATAIRRSAHAGCARLVELAGGRFDAETRRGKNTGCAGGRGWFECASEADAVGAEGRRARRACRAGRGRLQLRSPRRKGVRVEAAANGR